MQNTQRVSSDRKGLQICNLNKVLVNENMKNPDGIRPGVHHSRWHGDLQIFENKKKAPMDMKYVASVRNNVSIKGERKITVVKWLSRTITRTTQFVQQCKKWKRTTPYTNVDQHIYIHIHIHGPVCVRAWTRTHTDNTHPPHKHKAAKPALSAVNFSSATHFVCSPQQTHICTGVCAHVSECVGVCFCVSVCVCVCVCVCVLCVVLPVCVCESSFASRFG
jgi:hypothetical protein